MSAHPLTLFGSHLEAYNYNIVENIKTHTILYRQTNPIFPNQACLWGPYFLFRNSLLDRGGRGPPEPPGGSPAMIIQFPGPLLGCPKNKNPQKSPNSNTAVTSPDFEKSESPKNRPTPTLLLHLWVEKQNEIQKNRPTPTPLLHLRTLKK